MEQAIRNCFNMADCDHVSFLLTDHRLRSLVNSLPNSLELEIESQENRWLPIGTAPKKGIVPILIYLGNYAGAALVDHVRICVAFWFEDHWQAPGNWIRKDLVTHWMPLPESPKEPK